MNTTRRTGLLLAFGTACISGVAVFLNSYGVKAFGDASTYTTAKNVVATLVLVLLAGAMSARRRGTVLTRPTRPRQWAGLAVVGVFGGAVAFLLFFEGLARATSTDAAFLHKTLLVWVALLALPLLGERLGAIHVVAIALLVVGQIGLAGGVTTIFGQGQLMVLGATLVWAAEVVVAKRLLADLSSWTVGLTRMGVGSVVLVAWTLIRGQGGALTALTGEQWMWVLLTGVILAGYVSTWFAALSRVPAARIPSARIPLVGLDRLSTAPCSSLATPTRRTSWGAAVATTIARCSNRPRRVSSTEACVNRCGPSRAPGRTSS